MPPRPAIDAAPAARPGKDQARGTEHEHEHGHEHEHEHDPDPGPENDPNHDPDHDLPPPRGHAPLMLRALRVLWPAFAMAGVLEALVFVVVDPATLHTPAGDRLAWSASAVHSVAFFVFWGVIAAASAATDWLRPPADPPWSS